MTLSHFADVITIIAGLLAIVAFFIALEWRQDYQEQQVDKIAQDILELLDCLYFEIQFFRNFFTFYRVKSPIEILFEHSGKDLSFYTDNLDSYKEDLENNPQSSPYKNTLNNYFKNPEQDSELINKLSKADKEREIFINDLLEILKKIYIEHRKIILKFQSYSRRVNNNTIKEEYSSKIYNEIISCLEKRFKAYQNLSKYNLEKFKEEVNNEYPFIELISYDKCPFPNIDLPENEIKKGIFANIIGIDDFSQTIEKNFQSIIKQLEDKALIKSNEVSPQ